MTEIINDKIPSYHIDKVPEGYNEALLKKTDFTFKENDRMKKINLNQIEHPLSHCL